VVASVLPPFGNALRGNFAPSGAVVIDWTHPLTRGLVLCRVGDQALDLTGHNPDGNWSPDTNVVSPSTGFEGPSILTNASGSVGVGADMQFGSMPDLQTGGDITFFCRLDIQSTVTHNSTYCGFMCYGAGSSNAIYNLAQPTSATTLRFEVQNGSGSYQAATSAGNLSINTPYSLCGIVNGATINCWVNATKASASYTGTPHNGSGSCKMAIGRDMYDTGAGRWSNAKHFLDLVYNRALSDDEYLFLQANPYCFLLPAEYDMPAAFVAAAVVDGSYGGGIIRVRGALGGMSRWG
jgi:hypothetical protein